MEERAKQHLNVSIIWKIKADVNLEIDMSNTC